MTDGETREIFINYILPFLKAFLFHNKSMTFVMKNFDQVRIIMKEGEEQEILSDNVAIFKAVRPHTIFKMR